MKAEIPETYLDNLIGKKVLLYLSSTPYKQEYLQLPYDYVILNSKELFENRQIDSPIRVVDDKVILMAFDNNKAILILKDHGVKIQCFVGIIDGCCQGGNYECVNTNSFFGRLSPILDDNIYYITEHFGMYSDLADALTNDLGFLNVHYVPTKSFDDSLLFDESVFLSEYLRTLKGVFTIPLKRSKEKTMARTIGSINLMVSHSSIWDHEDDFDCIIYNDLSQEGHENYLPQNHIRDYVPLKQVKNESFQYVLKQAEKNSWKNIALVPYLKGRYQEVIDYCRNWKGKYPERIHFFHLEEKDLSDLKFILDEDKMVI